MSDQPAPIIVKRKKVIAGGHHGGAWKVAYADFVTAMMAFFLLMWLLGATTEKQRKGIADYFNPTIPVNKVSGGGAGAFGGDSVFTENTLAKNGTGAGLTVPPRVTDAEETKGSVDYQDASQTSDEEAPSLEELADTLSGRSGESLVSDLMKRHVITRLTDEGLIIELFDVPQSPLFTGTDEPTDALEAIVVELSDVMQLAKNSMAIHGHTATVPLAARENPVWELSMARADRVRQLLFASGISPKRVQRVTGFADRKPVALDHLAARNNRLEIILLRSKR